MFVNYPLPSTGKLINENHPTNSVPLLLLFVYNPVNIMLNGCRIPCKNPVIHTGTLCALPYKFNGLLVLRAIHGGGLGNRIDGLSCQIVAFQKRSYRHRGCMPPNWVAYNNLVIFFNGGKWLFDWRSGVVVRLIFRIPICCFCIIRAIRDFPLDAEIIRPGLCDNIFCNPLTCATP